MESIRAELEAEGHPAERKLKEVLKRLSVILAPVHQTILGETPTDQP